ncbi:MAG: hypothetical protein Q8L47_00735 [bacterium]|nr:hypothetical protein [bacterium]
MRRKSIAEVLAAEPREEVHVPEKDSAEFDMGDIRDRVHILHTMLVKPGQYFTFGVSYFGENINNTERLLKIVENLNRAGILIGQEEEALYGFRILHPGKDNHRYLEIFRRR